VLYPHSRPILACQFGLPDHALYPRRRGCPEFPSLMSSRGSLSLAYPFCLVLVTEPHGGGTGAKQFALLGPRGARGRGLSAALERTEGDVQQVCRLLAP
jgi:hypothetical protein